MSNIVVTNILLLIPFLFIVSRILKENRCSERCKITVRNIKEYRTGSNARRFDPPNLWSPREYET